MEKFRPFMAVIMLGALIASGAFFYQYAAGRHVKPLPVIGQVEDFKLKSTERDISLADLKGKVWVADFMFTTCSGICPMLTKNLARLNRVYQRQPDIYMVSISVNPDNDTPDVLKSYAQKNKLNTAKWYFLTGPSEDIQKIAVRSFKLGAIDEPVFHSSYFTLVDRQARIRGYYDGTDPKNIDQISRDIAQLLKER